MTTIDAEKRLRSMLRAEPQRLRRRSISLGVPVDEADDAAQIAALRAWRGLEHLQSAEPGAMCAWIDSIARRTAIDLHRARRDDLGEVLCDRLEGPHDLEAEAVTCERLSAALRAIRDLPEELRVPLTLSVVDDKSAPEIAAQLGLTPAAVRQRIARARKALRL